MKVEYGRTTTVKVPVGEIVEWVKKTLAIDPGADCQPYWVEGPGNSYSIPDDEALELVFFFEAGGRDV